VPGSNSPQMKTVLISCPSFTKALAIISSNSFIVHSRVCLSEQEIERV
jgi:hypothetical protein